jgi:acetyl-CoA synthetase
MTDGYDQAYRDFQWEIPTLYNIGVDICDDQARRRNQTAIIVVDEQSKVAQRFSFDEIRRLSNRLANSLKADGLAVGDRVAVLHPPSLEAAIAHVAILKAGFVSVPLPPSLAEEGLQYRLSTSGARILVTDLVGSIKLNQIRTQLARPIRAYTTSATMLGPQDVAFSAALDVSSEDFDPMKTRANDPAVLAFTSGTGGTPKGVLHAHRSLLGCLPVFELLHDGVPAAGEVFWTSAEWGWIAGLFPVFGAWHYGMSVVAWRAARFDPQRSLILMAEHEVRHAFIPPTALRLMRLTSARHGPIRLRTLLSGGERLGDELLVWAKNTFGVPIQEVYGQSECHGVVASNVRLFALRPGSMGRPIPGHDVRIVDDSGTELPRGRAGIVGVRQPDPATFLGYWGDPAATAEKFAGEFLLTGDIASQDEDGYFWFAGRDDDVITSSGYRIDPSEVEACIVKHASVLMAAVVGVPDAVCTESIKAWIVLRPGYSPSAKLARAIQQFVRNGLAPHQCPRHVSFIDALPLNSSGKIMRRELRSRG